MSRRVETYDAIVSRGGGVGAKKPVAGKYIAGLKDGRANADRRDKTDHCCCLRKGRFVIAGGGKNRTVFHLLGFAPSIL